MTSGTAATIVFPMGVNACDQVTADGCANALLNAAGSAIPPRSRAP